MTVMLLLWILFGSCLLCRYKSLSLAAKISVIGSGNFGTAMARKVALNVGERQRNTEEYDKTVRMWVYEEVVNGRNLTEIINSDHINIKYLPNVILPTNIIAYSDLIDAATDADVLLLVMPHQYLPGVLSQIKGKIKKDAICVSLIKGISFKPSGPELISETIANVLETNKVGVMMGANVANDVAADHYVESTIASIDSDVIETISKLFKHETFHTQKSDDVSTVEYCGALKNVIALGAGTYALHYFLH